MLTVKEEVAKNLSYHRKRKNYTQKELAERLNVKHNAVSSWENGVNSVDIDVLFRICEIFEISVSDMYGVFSNAHAEQYTRAEKKMISDYRALNDEGQEKLTDYAKDLVASGRYIKIDTHKMVEEKRA